MQSRDTILLVSKQDGNITKEIRTPFKEKKLFLQLLRHEGGTRAAGPGEYSRIIPFNGNWILLEPSSDTIYTLMPDYNLRPFIVRTPPIHIMNPESFLVLKLVSDRYYFMESVTNIYDSAKKKAFREPTSCTIQRKRISSGISYTMAIILIKKNFIWSC